MRMVTFKIPDEMFDELSIEAQKRHITKQIAAEEAFRLWLKSSAKDISKIAGPTTDMRKADRDRVSRYIEFVRIGSEDMKVMADRRVKRFVELALEEIMGDAAIRRRFRQ